jgi:hypothetical protein
VLVTLALTMVAVERALRGRARYHQALGRGDWQAFGRAMQELRQELTRGDEVAP